MTQPDPERPSRMENLLPGVPLGSKVALMLGVAGGLFAAIVISYTDPDRQFQALGVGITVGAIAAIALWLRSFLHARRA